MRISFLAAVAVGCGCASIAGAANIGPVRAEAGARPSTSAATGAPVLTRPAPPERMKAPFKPLDLKSAGVGAQQATVRWTVPDQGDGREIQQWLVRACPKVDGNPYAACQQVGGPMAGQASGTTVDAQIPAHVQFMGSQTPVSGAEVCAANSAGTSCADRLALQFINIATAPVQRPMGISAAQGSHVPLSPQPVPSSVAPANTPAATPNAPPSGGFGSKRPGLTTAGPVAATPATPSAPPSGGFGSKRLQLETPAPASAAPAARNIATAPSLRPAATALVKPPEPIAVAANALRFKATAAPELSPISVETVALHVKVATVAPPADISVTSSVLRLSATQGPVKAGHAMALKSSALSTTALSVNAQPLRITVTAAPPMKPIAVDASPLSFKASAPPPPTPISVTAPALTLTATSAKSQIR